MKFLAVCNCCIVVDSTIKHLLAAKNFPNLLAC